MARCQRQRPWYAASGGGRGHSRLRGRAHRGAIAWHWQKDLHDPLRRDFIDANGPQELLTRSGVGDETTVILYGANSNWFAAYAYWYLKYQGFDSVKLLNGGRKKWEREGRPMTAERPTVTPAATHAPEAALC